MVSTRRALVAVLVGAAAVLAAAAAITKNGGDTHHTAASSGRASTPAGSSAASSSTAAPVSPSTPKSKPPPENGPFTLAVMMRSGNIRARVGSISVASHESVDPPHITAEQWNTAVWVEQSAYPSAQSQGTSYVYGHACHYHRCPFTNLYQARVGDRMIVATATARLAYRIVRIGLSSRSATSLPAWASDSTVPDRMVLVTCAFEQGDISTQNIVVVASRSNT